jgi:hypothetical protein
MKKFAVVFAIVLFTASQAFSADIQFSGVLDTTLSVIMPPGDLVQNQEYFYFSFEEFANLRLRANLNDNITFFGAFNLIATSGMSAYELYENDYISINDFFVGKIELERLYAHYVNDFFGVDLGLMRVAYGYGLAFKPLDFLNIPNPIYPLARPRAILGAAASLFLGDMADIRLLVTAPQNAILSNGDGILAALSGEFHTGFASFQGLFSYRTQDINAPLGMFRAGLAAKTDLIVGIFAEALFEYTPETVIYQTINSESNAQNNIAFQYDLDFPLFGHNGIAATLGVDYSFDLFSTSKLYLMAEYLYSSEESSLANTYTNKTGFHHNNYLSAVCKFFANDFLSIDVNTIMCIDDITFLPALGISYEVFQGGTLTGNFQVPLPFDGEYGATNLGIQFKCDIRFSLRI